MPRVPGVLLGLIAIVLAAGASSAAAQDKSRPVEGGGISVPGWVGRIDPKEMAAGAKLEDARLAKDGEALHVTTGPAVAYWNPDKKASGDYTVKATFKESKFMNLNDHAHPYGVFIGGNEMGTDRQTYLYCATYGDGRFIVRGFGPAPFQMNGRGAANPAVNKAAGKGEPVTQEIALSVKGGKVECAINGAVVATYDKSAVVASGKLASTDGAYGIRLAHNTEALVTGFEMTRP
jgi:hypothetical protein